jgi:hypothetical protein
LKAFANMDRQADIAKMLQELHASFLKGNEYDEGDLLFYRINYRLAEAFGLAKEEAEKFHAAYHDSNNPRRVSQGYCDTCSKVVTIVPVIYGIQDSDMERMEAAEGEGRLILGDTSSVRQGGKVAMFGCKTCRSLLPKYGTL